MIRQVIEIIDGEDDELIGFGICVLEYVEVSPGVTRHDYSLEPDVYGVRSEAYAALNATAKEARS